MREPTDWQEDDLLDLIANKYEENIQLDYKRSDALQATDGKCTEISKAVSAFANSIGGTILYGMQESEDPPHYAQSLSPIDPKVISKEWLEQVINSRIHPRLTGLVINPVDLKNSAPGSVAYVVVIPEGSTAHQAYDKRYYKRFNFKSVPMEDYEVRQTMNRSLRPVYKVDLHAIRRGASADGRPLSQLQLIVENQSDMVGRDVSAVLYAPAALLNSADSNRTTFQNVEYTRIAGTYIPNSTTQLSTIPCVPPLAPCVMSFSKAMWLPVQGPHVTLVVKVFDQFGLAVTAYYRHSLNGLRMEKEINAAQRIPGGITVSHIEELAQ
jgi:hypothetical protein